MAPDFSRAALAKWHSSKRLQILKNRLSMVCSINPEKERETWNPGSRGSQPRRARNTPPGEVKTTARAARPRRPESPISAGRRAPGGTALGMLHRVWRRSCDSQLMDAHLGEWGMRVRQGHRVGLHEMRKRDGPALPSAMAQDSALALTRRQCHTPVLPSSRTKSQINSYFI